MKSKIMFGRWETATVITNIICMQIFLGFSRTMAEGGATAGWLQALYLSVLALIAFVVISKLYKTVVGMDIVDIGEYVAGPVGRIVMGVIYFPYFIFVAVVIIREFSENMKTVEVPMSPLSFVTLFFIIAIIATSYLGLEALVRMHALIVPLIIAGLVIILVACWPHYKIENIQPYLGTGTKALFIDSLPKVSHFSGVVIILFMSPFIGGHKNFARAGYSAILISGVALTLTTLCYLLMTPYPAAIRSFLPIYTMAREITFGRFIQRGEPVFVFIWSAAGMLHLSSIFYFALVAMKKAFKLEYTRPLILPCAIIVFTLSFLPQSLMSVLDLDARYFRTYAWIPVFALPILLLSAAFLKKRKDKEVGKCQE